MDPPCARCEGAVRSPVVAARDLIPSAHGIHRTFTAPDDSGCELEVQG
jgi:hypothetical protein